MTYLEAKEARNTLDADVSRLSAALKIFPKGPTGLTPDADKSSPGYTATKASFDAAFKRLRSFNSYFLKAFPTEIRADRLSRRKAQ